MSPPPLDVVRGVPLFAGLPEADLEAVAALFGEQTFPAGATITREGERGARVLAFFVITEGAAEVAQGAARVATLGPGDHFGEIGLFEDVPRTATVTAASDLTCLTLAAWRFRPFLEANPQVAVRLLEEMARRLEELRELARQAGG